MRPGGRIVYSTCSIEPEENDERVAVFLNRHPSFSAEPVEGLPDGFADGGVYRSLPHRHGLDGAFAAVLRAPV